MRQNADGSADAQVEWTDRGKAFFAADRFRYFSPEWYDRLGRPGDAHPAPGRGDRRRAVHPPVFKPPALRPLLRARAGLR
jgi:hypothetical protein